MRGTLKFHRLKYRPSANKPTLPQLIRYPPDLGIYILNLFDMALGPLSVFQVGGRDTRFTLRGPGSGGLAPMHSAPVPICDDRVLARHAPTGFSQAPLPWPVDPEPRCNS